MKQYKITITEDNVVKLITTVLTKKSAKAFAERKIEYYYPNATFTIEEQDLALKCICCNKKLELLFPEIEFPKDKSRIDKGLSSAMIDGGSVNQISYGYGSTKFDTSIHLLSICDDCAEKALNNQQLIHLGNYL